MQRAVYNCETGKLEIQDMTPEEEAAHLADQAAMQAAMQHAAEHPQPMTSRGAMLRAAGELLRRQLGEPPKDN